MGSHLLTLDGCRAHPYTARMKLLTLNIQHGGGSRTAEIIDFIDSDSFDVVVLTEFRRNASGRKITAHLQKRGMQWTAPTVSNPKQNTVLIASKGLTPIKLDSLPNDWSIHGAKVGGLSVLGVYLPQKGLKELPYRWLLDRMPSMQRTVVLGDFNTGLNDLDVQGRSKFWCEQEFRTLSQDIFVDAFREANGASREYSWFSKAGNGFRVDHALLSEDLLPNLGTAVYLHNSRPLVSDHSALTLELCDV